MQHEHRQIDHGQREHRRVEQGQRRIKQERRVTHRFGGRFTLPWHRIQRIWAYPRQLILSAREY